MREQRVLLCAVVVRLADMSVEACSSVSAAAEMRRVERPRLGCIFPRMLLAAAVI